ncbi:MAG: 4Fe-4S dicluster domain-containing protein [Acidobacteria bacterium]|nr:MAG: 4Fe-4S dicluster domain-containing protein [Acidobacteriota bacterium]
MGTGGTRGRVPPVTPSTPRGWNDRGGAPGRPGETRGDRNREERESEMTTTSPTTDTTRRGFLLGLGAGAAAALAACKRLPVEHALPFPVAPEEVVPGVPSLYASTCTACTASCGLTMRVLDGRPVKLEGRAGHPLSGGGICAVGQADLRALYDASRLRGPLLDGKPATWEALDARVEAGLADVAAGKGRLFLVTPTLVSPAEREAVSAFLARFGGTLVERDPGVRSASAVLAAWEALDGTPLVPSLSLDACDLLVTFSADLLGTGPEPVAHTAAWSARKREERFAPRHVAVEGSLSLTGAAADERWPATSSDERLALLRLLALVAGHAGPAGASVASALAPVPKPAGLPAERLSRLASDLWEARGRSLVATGSTDAAQQLAAAVLNRLLGNEGRTVHPDRPSLTRRGREEDLEAFLAAVNAGEAAAVVFLDTDPVDQLPAGEALAEALKKVPLTVAITDRPTGTAAACAAVAAAHHSLERWGDREPRPGLVTLAQPGVRPIFDTRPPVESLLRWSGASVVDARLHLMGSVRRRHAPGMGDAEFAAFWTESVAAGALPEAPLPAPAPRDASPRPEAVAFLAAEAARPSARPGLEVELVEEVALRDGRNAHVPWLRELPDPLTRVSWTPALRLAPARARTLGVADGDVVEVTASGAKLALPARIVPGQHPDVIGVPVGYGRTDGDAAASGRNAYRLARLAGGRLQSEGLPAVAARTGRHEPLPLMQPHGTTEGRPVVFQVPERDDKVPPPEPIAGKTLWPERRPTSPKWEMVVDLDACTGCSACVVSCQAENNLPVVGPDEIRRSRDMFWLRVDRYFLGDGEAPDVLFTTTLCAQCGNAPCETVCPVAATVHSEDGLNQQVYNRCVGTRYCANNCPYKVRRFNWFQHDVKDPLERLVLNPSVVVRDRGVMEKCTFCVQRIQAGRIAARRGGDEGWRGGGVATACQESCPARAITFGDATDPDGEVARLKKSPRAFQVLAELGVAPAVTYLAHVRSREGEGAAGGHGEKGGHA